MSNSGINKVSLERLYAASRKRFGFLNWWPGESALEIVVGAVLTQQTSWSNVEKAIHNLKANGLLDIEKLSNAEIGTLEKLIKSSGYFRQKAKRLQSLCRFIINRYGDLDLFLKLDKAELRERLLSQKGIGKETCDSIMLYAAGKRIFVVDAYTKRILSRVFSINENIGYDELQKLLQDNTEKSTTMFKDMHAQFVEVGKNFCKKSNPICADCPLNKMCAYAGK